MPDYQTSEVGFQEEQAAVLPIVPSAATDAAVVGVTQRGPFGPTLVTSFDEYLRLYGEHIAYSKIPLWMKTAFEESGGGKIFMNRVVHCTDPNDPTSRTSAAGSLVLSTPAIAAGSGEVLGSIVGPFVVQNGDHLDVKVDGGAAVVATINAVSAKNESAAGPFTLVDNGTLIVKIGANSAQTITFDDTEFVNIAAATAAEVAAAINARLNHGKAATSSGGTKVTMESDAKGSGITVAVQGGTSAAALGFSASAAGSGNVANNLLASTAEIVTLVDAALSTATVSNVGGALKIVSNTVGGSSSIQIAPTSTLADELGFDFAIHTGVASGAVPTLQVLGKTEGSYSSDVRIRVLPVPSGDTALFTIHVEYKGRVVESDWVNLSMDPTHPRYAPLLVNDPATGSDFIQLVDQTASVPASLRNPNLGTFGPLVGGSDGLVGLNDADFTGGSGSNGRTGLRSFDVIPSVRMVAVPGRATPVVHAAGLTYVDVQREQTAVFIPDLPTGLDTQGAVNYVKNVAGIQRLSEFGAVHWPHHYVANPNRSVYGETDLVLVPISAHIIGATQRNARRSDTAIWQAAAGTRYGTLKTARKPENDEVLDKEKRKLLFPELINPVHSEDGSAVFIDGSRCLDDSGPFPTLGERMGVNFLKKSLETGLRPLRHVNITPRLYAEGTNAVNLFMLGQTTGGAFASAKPSEAYQFDMGASLNTPSTRLKRRVLGKLSIATAKPAEFVTIIVSPDSRALDAELAAAAAA